MIEWIMPIRHEGGCLRRGISHWWCHLVRRLNPTATILFMP